MRRHDDAAEAERARLRKICFDKLALADRALASQEGSPFTDSSYRAAVVMTQDVLRDILQQIEPKERVRELRDDEQAAILPAVPEGYRDVVRFALMSGCRLAECVNLLWSDVDWGAREISVLGKGGERAAIPLTTEMRALLFPLRTHHPERVFTYPVRKKRGLRAVGDRLPVTYEGMKTAWRRAIKTAGVENFRFHDNRHTAATRLLRHSGNLVEVRDLLRHSDIATTAKYAHVTREDLRRSMEGLGERAEGADEGPVKVTK